MADTFTPKINLIKPDVLKDALIGDINGNMDKIDTEFTNVDNRLDAIDTTAPADNGPAVVAAPNWTLDSIKLYKVGKLVYGYFSATRSANAIGGVATGNIVNTLIFTLPNGYKPIVDCTWAGGGGLSTAMYNGMIQTDGKAYVTVALPNVGFAVGDVTSGSFMFMVP